MAVPRFSFYNYKFYIMGLFDYFLKKREEQKREKQRAEEAANHRKFEEERIVNEREKCLEENRQKEAELQARLKVEREQALQIEPLFSNQTVISDMRMASLKWDYKSVLEPYA